MRPFPAPSLFNPRRVLSALLCCTTPALAHPVDEVVQGAYLTLTPGTVQLELDITPGSKVASSVLKALDANQDGKVQPQEAQSYARNVLSQSTLKLNGQNTLWTLQSTEIPPLEDLRLGSATLKIYAQAKRTDLAGVHSLSYLNRYTPAKSQWVANVFLQPSDQWVYQVNAQKHSNDGQTLSVQYTVKKP
jgi:hypothetical protein